MQEYKITGDTLKELYDLTCNGYEIDEVDVCMGYAAITLKHFEDITKLKVIMLETI